MSAWTLVFMDENNYVFYREPLEPNTPIPESPQWRITKDEEPIRMEPIQFLELPYWHGTITTYHTIINYVTKEFVVSVHGIYGDVTNG